VTPDMSDGPQRRKLPFDDAKKRKDTAQRSRRQARYEQFLQAS
jgi:hypothetical protein